MIKAAQQDENNPNGDIPEVDVPKCLTRRFEVCIHPTGKDKRAPRKLRDVRAADIGHLVCEGHGYPRHGRQAASAFVRTFVITVAARCISQCTAKNLALSRSALHRAVKTQKLGHVVMQGRGTRFVKYACKSCQTKSQLDIFLERSVCTVQENRQDSAFLVIS